MLVLKEESRLPVKAKEEKKWTTLSEKALSKEAISAITSTIDAKESSSSSSIKEQEGPSPISQPAHAGALQTPSTSSTYMMPLLSKTGRAASWASSVDAVGCFLLSPIFKQAWLLI
ncbi:hypothetical protein GOP47_0020824 [Adiantum capillus-veneris]|uniref:Uncharacterized protein n=1 Tax=Adiantum capillus-veneris TaxID=13818 RepID=A0A9D4UBH4_ADICA|nr:hypothetical protein GOP47_0020824 [Adiantum capillus-veneris]